MLQAGPADVERVEAIVETPEDQPETANGPPNATVARRAKSYSDFYDVVRAHLKKEKDLERKREREALANDLDFVEW